MSTPHNNAQLNEIAKNVIMPGDPKRATFIAENFLDNYKIVNDVRSMITYTGFYKGKEVTIMPSGMGIPSMGIYSYELFKFYDVDNIIRIGSCGALSPDVKLFDIVLSEQVYSESNFAYTFDSNHCHLVESSSELNNKIKSASTKCNIPIVSGITVCSEVFDPYMADVDSYLKRLPDMNFLSAEMEAFSLFYIAKKLNKNASCIMSVTDSKFTNSYLDAKDREAGLNKMIKLALESI